MNLHRPAARPAFLAGLRWLHYLLAALALCAGSVAMAAVSANGRGCGTAHRD